MSKANRDNLLQRGEQLLKEWDVATDADAAAAVGGLRAAMGRDPAADVAIASRLGALADPASVEALLRLAEAPLEHQLDAVVVERDRLFPRPARGHRQRIALGRKDSGGDERCARRRHHPDPQTRHYLVPRYRFASASSARGVSAFFASSISCP